ncbi:MAG: DUF3883 domain-containing protein [Betaproteobacteria bacterium]|nr:DUF3883 domain-containing protein [Betaproteobacteria bacterium]
MSNSWSREEVEATVADYFDMLTMQLTGQQYSKTDHRRRLQRLLSRRSEGAIERKHQNISAILIELDCPWIPGYKPLGNYQALLFDVVENRLKASSIFDEAALAAVQMPAAVPKINDFANLVVEPPRVSHSAREPTLPSSAWPSRSVARRDYLEREARNSSLGLAGERFVVQYERWRLHSLGEPKLAKKIEHVSVTRGDGLGFDVLSFDVNGRETLIEVKTTSFGRETPFFITRNEVALSQSEADSFHIYRLFDFRREPRLFSLRGPVEKHCNLDPVTYQARFS